jgi:PadR family transcriptional regulator, regulatory protein PadR
LLHVLTFGEGNGWDLKRRIHERTKGRFTMNNGSLYPTLKVMEAAGLVTGRNGPDTFPASERPMRYYRLTAKGKKAAQDASELVRDLFSEE